MKNAIVLSNVRFVGHTNVWLLICVETYISDSLTGPNL